jgi:hypothetical protein
VKKSVAAQPKLSQKEAAYLEQLKAMGFEVPEDRLLAALRAHPDNIDHGEATRCPSRSLWHVREVFAQHVALASDTNDPFYAPF